MNTKRFLILILILLLISLAVILLVRRSEPVGETPDEPIPVADDRDTIEKERVEDYLRQNIRTLSPVQPAAGGSWYVILVTTDPSKNMGIVAYEDGHIQEQRKFTYETEQDLTIKTLVIGESVLSSSGSTVGN